MSHWSPSTVMPQPHWELERVDNLYPGPNLHQAPLARPPSFLKQLLLGRRQDWMGGGPGDRTGVQGYRQVS